MASRLSMSVSCRLLCAQRSAHFIHNHRRFLNSYHKIRQVYTKQKHILEPILHTHVCEIKDMIFWIFRVSLAPRVRLCVKKHPSQPLDRTSRKERRQTRLYFSTPLLLQVYPRERLTQE